MGARVERDEAISAGRATSLRRVLAAALALAIVLLVVGVVLVVRDHGPYGLVLGGVLTAAVAVSLMALRSRGRAARVAAVVTAVLFLVVSVPLVGLFGVGLLTALTGVGLLFVALGPEREE